MLKALVFFPCGALVAVEAVGQVSVNSVTVKTNMVGMVVPIVALTYNASYGIAKRGGGATTTTQATYQAYDVADGAKQTQLALGVVYDMSKRTAIYGTYGTQTVTGLNANADNGMKSVANNTASSSVSATAFDLGIRHRF